MKPKSLLLQVSIAVIMVASYNGLINKMVQNSPAYRLASSVKTMEPATDIFLGNSLMEAGFNPEIFQATYPSRKAINLGLGSTSTPEHCILLEASKNQSSATVYYGFFDLQLTEDTPSRWPDLVGNRVVGLICGNTDAALSVYAPNDPVGAKEIAILSRIPIALNRTQIWAKTELLRRKVGSFGLTAKKTNEFGNVDDFAALEKNAGAMAEECSKFVRSKGQFSLPIRKIIGVCKTRGLKLAFIKMPAPSRHRKFYYGTKEWKQYEAYCSSLISSAGARYINASAWAPDTAFSDILHLNHEGSKEFTRRLIDND